MWTEIRTEEITDAKEFLTLEIARDGLTEVYVEVVFPRKFVEGRIASICNYRLLIRAHVRHMRFNHAATAIAHRFCHFRIGVRSLTNRPNMSALVLRTSEIKSPKSFPSPPVAKPRGS